MYHKTRVGTWLWFLCCLILAGLIVWILGFGATYLPHVSEEKEEATTHTIAFMQTLIGICSITAVFTFLHKSLRVSIKKCLQNISYPEKHLIETSWEAGSDNSEKETKLTEEINAIISSIKKDLHADITCVASSKARYYMWRTIIILSAVLLLGIVLIYTGKSSSICYTCYGWFMLLPVVYAFIGYQAIKSPRYWKIEFDGPMKATLKDLENKISQRQSNEGVSTEDLVRDLEQMDQAPVKVHVLIVE